MDSDGSYLKAASSKEEMDKIMDTLDARRKAVVEAARAEIAREEGRSASGKQ
jgi:hypothetical protein